MLRLRFVLLLCFDLFIRDIDGSLLENIDIVVIISVSLFEGSFLKEIVLNFLHDFALKIIMLVEEVLVFDFVDRRNQVLGG